MSKTQLKALTYNVRGLNDKNKVRHLINYCNKEYLGKDFDAVIGLQETNIEKAGIIPYIWRGNYFLTPGTGNSKGCITLLSSHLQVVEHRAIEDRCHVVACQRSDSQNVNYIVANVYGPNQHNNDKIVFFERIVNEVTELEIKYDCHNVIILGDLNIILRDNERKNRSFTATEKRIGKVINSLFKESNMIDIWKQRMEYTWRRPNTDTFSTLDRILYREDQLTLVKTEVDWSLGFSDHAAVKVIFADKTRITSRGKLGCQDWTRR